MSGRPPIPIAQRRQQGDTRKVGTEKFNDSIRGTFEPTRGRPRMPAALNFRKSKSLPDESPELKAQRLREDSDRRSLLAMARKHWAYVADNLEREKKLSLLDEGMLTTLALSYAQMVVAGSLGLKAFKDLSQRYMQAADRMGLNESARARIPAAPNRGASDPLELGLGSTSKTA